MKIMGNFYIVSILLLLNMCGAMGMFGKFLVSFFFECVIELCDVRFHLLFLF